MLRSLLPFRTIRNQMIRIVLVGDYSPDVIAHAMIPKAVALAAKHLGIEIELSWAPTDQLAVGLDIIKGADAIWCVPGSPYKSMDGALRAIRCVRESKTPFLGTCGGFQHAVIEYARHALELSDADHRESNPNAATPIIDKLSCALVNKSEDIRLLEGSRLHQIYGATEATEAYQCSYGLNPAFRDRFAATPFKLTAFGSDGAVRGFELEGHPFFAGTLFQPERSADSGRPHPLITAFIAAAI